jgi:RNA polymerase sigma-70 factor (ECF subfamily)
MAVAQRGLQHVLDEYLVLLAKAGNQDAFGRLRTRWTPRLLAFAARSTSNADAAKDVVQETWESALRGIGRLEDPARFPAWIYSIAARKCTNQLRAKYRGQRLTAAMEQDVVNEVAAPSALEARLDLATALKQLPREQRVAVALLYGEDMSVVDIAVITGVPPGTVKSRLSAARLALRMHMEGESDEQS